MHIFPKNDPGDWRPCSDYGALNARRVHDRYPILHVQDFTGNLDGTKVFCKRNLVKHIISCQWNLQTFRRRQRSFGPFRYVGMPFGFRNVAHKCHRFMAEVIRGLHLVFTFLDYLLIASASLKNHAVYGIIFQQVIFSSTHASSP